MPVSLASGVQVVDPDGDLLIILMPELGSVSIRAPTLIREDEDADRTEDGVRDRTCTRQAQRNDESGRNNERAVKQESIQETAEGDQKEEPPSYQYRVSLKHMSLASPRAKVMFSGPWVEATLIHQDGLKHWTIRAPFNPTAFGIVIKVIHGRNEMVPATVDLKLLVDIAAVVDDLGCWPVLSFFAKLWICHITSCTRIPSRPSPELTMWAFISYVFRDPGIFEHTTLVLINRDTEDLDTMDLLPLVKINDAIVEKRQIYLQQFEELLEDELDLLCSGTRNPCEAGVKACQSLIVGDAMLYVRNHQDLLKSSDEMPLNASLEHKLDALEMFHARPCYVPERPGNQMRWTLQLGYGQYIDPRYPLSLQLHYCDSRGVFGHIIDYMNKTIKGLTLDEIE